MKRAVPFDGAEGGSVPAGALSDGALLRQARPTKLVVPAGCRAMPAMKETPDSRETHAIRYATGGPL